MSNEKPYSSRAHYPFAVMRAVQVHDERVLVLYAMTSSEIPYAARYAIDTYEYTVDDQGLIGGLWDQRHVQEELLRSCGALMVGASNSWR